MRPSKQDGTVCEIVKSFRTSALDLPVDGSEDHSTISIKNSRVKLEQDSSSLNFQFCNFKDIADSEVEDADDKLFILKSDVMTEIVWKFHCWIVWIFFLFLIADYNVDGAVDEPSIFYYWRLRGQEFESRGGGRRKMRQMYRQEILNVPTDVI